MSDHEPIPTTLPSYAEEHPEALPDYYPFAYEAVDLLDTTSTLEIPVLYGPHEIGKTHLLIPAIAETAQRRGYEYRGSIGGGAGLFGVPVVRLDEHEWIQSKTSSQAQDNIDKHGNERSIVAAQRREESYELMARAVRRALRPNDREGLYVIDEPVLFTHYFPNFLHYMGQAAQENGVRLISLVPLVDRQYAEGWEQERLAGLEHEVFRNIANMTGMTVRPIKIAEQRVDLEAIQKILQVYNMDPELIQLFERNMGLRRLGNIGEFIEAFAQEVDDVEPAEPRDHDALLKLLESRNGWLNPKPFFDMDTDSAEQAAEGVGLPFSAYCLMMEDLAIRR